MNSCKDEHISSDEGDVWITNKYGDFEVFLDETEFISEEVKSLNNHGIEFVKRGEIRNAEIKYLEALKIEPNNPTILNNLGNIEKVKKNYEKSIMYYEKSLIASDSLYYSSAVNLGLLSNELHSYSRAIKLFEFVILKSKNPSQKAIAYLSLCNAYLSSGQCEKGKSVLKKSQKYLKINEKLAARYKYLEAKLIRCFK